MTPRLREAQHGRVERVHAPVVPLAARAAPATVRPPCVHPCVHPCDGPAEARWAARACGGSQPSACCLPRAIQLVCSMKSASICLISNRTKTRMINPSGSSIASKSEMLIACRSAPHWFIRQDFLNSSFPDFLISGNHFQIPGLVIFCFPDFLIF